MAQTFHCRVYITLRPSVLDPAGAALESGLRQLGYESVQQTRIGKYIELTLDAETAEAARQDLTAMCEGLLANTVIENYRFELFTPQGVGQ
ncbi:MAG: phosphoribosylformylglycinamidine synthase subunit PurS [Cyanobacteriota bacterium]|jgi:phosphoribosylformylglycinamidine synthase PurS subunit